MYGLKNSYSANYNVVMQSYYNNYNPHPIVVDKLILHQS